MEDKKTAVDSMVEIFKSIKASKPVDAGKKTRRTLFLSEKPFKAFQKHCGKSVSISEMVDRWIIEFMNNVDK